MSITNTSKPTTTYTNSSKVSIGETWGTITTTWASETRTWLDVSQLIDNESKISSSFANSSKPTFEVTSYDVQEDSTDWDTYATYPRTGQSFAGVYGNLTSCKFYMRKVGSPTGNVTAYLYAHSGTFGVNSVPTGSPLATSNNVDIASLTTSYALTEFTFNSANQYRMSTGVNYFIVYEYDAGNVSNALRTIIQDSPPLAAGNLAEYSAGVWTAYGSGGTSKDLLFYIYAR